MPRTPQEMRDAILRNLPEKTGRSAEDWVDVLRREGPLGKRKDRVEWLKREHGLGNGQASMIVDSLDRPEVFEQVDPRELVDAQYVGKGELREVYEALVKELLLLGDDVAVEARRSYVAFTRGRQFALAQPTTTTRLDVGLVLPGVEATARLRAAGSFGSGRTSHRVSLGALGDVDAELVGWLRAAYEAAAR
jgi:predicted transport protein